MGEYMDNIVSTIERIDADPKDVKTMVRRLHENLLTPITTRSKKLKEERKELWANIGNLPVIRKKGRKLTLRRLTALLKEDTPQEIMEDITVDDYWRTPPFSDLGVIPVSLEEPSPFDRGDH